MHKILLITLTALVSIIFAFEIYITASGRNTKLSKEDLKKCLTPLQYNVTKEGGTEKPFDNTFWNHKEAGIYIDIVTGEALFSSTDKFDSKSGWPSFTNPINKNAVETREGLRKLERVKICDPGTIHGGIVTFLVEGEKCADVATWLNDQGFSINYSLKAYGSVGFRKTRASRSL